MAAQQGYVEVVRLLLDYNAYPDIERRSDKTTPLFMAVQEGCVEVVRLLLEHGADPLKEDSMGASPIYYSAQKPPIEVTNLLSSAITKPASQQHSKNVLTGEHNIKKEPDPDPVKSIAVAQFTRPQIGNSCFTTSLVALVNAPSDSDMYGKLEGLKKYVEFCRTDDEILKVYKGFLSSELVGFERNSTHHTPKNQWGSATKEQCEVGIAQYFGFTIVADLHKNPTGEFELQSNCISKQHLSNGDILVFTQLDVNSTREQVKGEQVNGEQIVYTHPESCQVDNACTHVVVISSEFSTDQHYYIIDPNFPDQYWKIEKSKFVYWSAHQYPAREISVSVGDQHGAKAGEVKIKEEPEV